MVHFLQQRTKHLTVKILGFLTVHVAYVTEYLEMHFYVCVREKCTILIITFVWVSRFNKSVKKFKRSHCFITPQTLLGIRLL